MVRGGRAQRLLLVLGAAVLDTGDESGRAKPEDGAAPGTAEPRFLQLSGHFISSGGQAGGDPRDRALWLGGLRLADPVRKLRDPQRARGSRRLVQGKGS